MSENARDPEVGNQMHRVLDGEASKEEVRSFREACSRDPGLAAEYRGLEEISAIFRGAPRFDGNSDFADSVARRVFENPFRTETWPQLVPVIQRLLVAATVLIVVGLLTPALEAVRGPVPLFLPQDPPGLTPLRPALGELGQTLLREGTEGSSEILRSYTTGRGSFDSGSKPRVSEEREER